MIGLVLDGMMLLKRGDYDYSCGLYYTLVGVTVRVKTTSTRKLPVYIPNLVFQAILH